MNNVYIHLRDAGAVKRIARRSQDADPLMAKRIERMDPKPDHYDVQFYQLKGKWPTPELAAAWKRAAPPTSRGFDPQLKKSKDASPLRAEYDKLDAEARALSSKMNREISQGATHGESSPSAIKLAKLRGRMQVLKQRGAKDASPHVKVERDLSLGTYNARIRELGGTPNNKNQIRFTGEGGQLIIGNWWPAIKKGAISIETKDAGPDWEVYEKLLKQQKEARKAGNTKLALELQMKLEAERKNQTIVARKARGQDAQIQPGMKTVDGDWKGVPLDIYQKYAVGSKINAAGWGLVGTVIEKRQAKVRGSIIYQLRVKDSTHDDPRDFATRFVGKGIFEVTDPDYGLMTRVPATTPGAAMQAAKNVPISKWTKITDKKTKDAKEKWISGIDLDVWKKLRVGQSFDMKSTTYKILAKGVGLNDDYQIKVEPMAKTKDADQYKGFTISKNRGFAGYSAKGQGQSMISTSPDISAMHAMIENHLKSLKKNTPPATEAKKANQGEAQRQAGIKTEKKTMEGVLRKAGYSRAPGGQRGAEGYTMFKGSRGYITLAGNSWGLLKSPDQRGYDKSGSGPESLEKLIG